MLAFTARFEPDEDQQDGGFCVTFLDIPNIFSQGDDEQDAQAMALDALLLMLKHLIATGSPVPRPRKHRGKHLRSIALPALAAAKLELYWAFSAAGITKAEFARRINCPKANVDRLFDFSHHSRWDVMESALGAVGHRLDIVVQPAA